MAVLSRKSSGDTWDLVVDSDPSGVEAAPRASTARMVDGSAEWSNLDGGTTWQRTDVEAWPEALLEQFTRYVDGTNTDPDPDGTEARPFASIQDAVDDIAAIPGIGTNAAQRTVKVIGGRVFDEDITIPVDGGVWNMIAEVYTFVGIIPTSPRNVSRVTDPAVAIAGIDPALNFLAARSGAWVISGGVTVSDVGAGEPQTFSLEVGALVGIGATYAFDGSGMTAEARINFRDCDVAGVVYAPTTGVILKGRETDYSGSVRVKKILGDQFHCSFAGDVIVSEASNGYLNDCRVGGDWYGPAGSFKCDLSTWGTFTGTLFDGATVDLLDPHGSSHDPASGVDPVALLPFAVDGVDYRGTRTVAELDALSKRWGTTAVAGSAGTPAGGGPPVAIGDIVEWRGAAALAPGWRVVVANSGGTPPVGARLCVAGAYQTLFAPLTDDTDNGKIAVFPGGSLTPTLVTPSKGARAVVTNAAAFYVGREHQLIGAVPDGYWDPHNLTYYDAGPGLARNDDTGQLEVVAEVGLEVQGASVRLKRDGQSLQATTAAGTRVAGVDTVISPRYVGNRSIGEIDALSLSVSDWGITVIATSNGTPSKAGSDTLAIGDAAQYKADEDKWVKIRDNVGGYPAAGVRMLVASTDIGDTLYAPATGQSVKVAEWGGTSLTPAFIAPSKGWLYHCSGGELGALTLFGYVEIGAAKAWLPAGISDGVLGQGLGMSGPYWLQVKLGSGMTFDGSSQIIPSIDGTTIVDNGGTLEVDPGSLADDVTIVEGGSGLEVDPDAHSHHGPTIELQDDCLSAWYMGGRTVAQLDLMGVNDHYTGMTVRAESAGTPAYSGSATVAIGDLIQWSNDSGWQVIVANSGGYVPSGTRVYIAGQPSPLYDECVGHYGKGATFPGDAAAAVIDSALKPSRARVNIVGDGYSPAGLLELTIEGSNGRWDPPGGWEFSARNASQVDSTTVAPAAFDDVIEFNSPLIPSDQAWQVTWCMTVKCSNGSYDVFVRARWDDKTGSDLIGDEYVQENMQVTTKRAVCVSDAIRILGSGRTGPGVKFSTEIGTENASGTASSVFSSIHVKQINAGALGL